MAESDKAEFKTHDVVQLRTTEDMINIQFKFYMDQLENDNDMYPVDMLEKAVSIFWLACKRKELRSNPDNFQQFSKFLKEKLTKPRGKEVEKLTPEELDRVTKYIGLFKETFKNFYPEIQESEIKKINEEEKDSGCPSRESVNEFDVQE